MSRRRAPRLGILALLLIVGLALPSLGIAGPRSGSSFGSRSGFRTGGGFNMPRSSSPGYGYRSSPHVFYPSYGWGWGGGYGGMGYGGIGMGTLLFLGVLGVSAFLIVRTVKRRNLAGTNSFFGANDDDDASSVAAGKGYVYRLQIALGRSARGVQDRLAAFAEQGDTNSESGLAALIQQTALELLREKDSIRYAAGEGTGPMSLTNAETKLNGLSLTERSRFQVERLRGADGKMRRSDVAAEEGKEALEFVLVTLIVATRTPLGDWKDITDHARVETLLGQLGQIPPSALLGIEVIWTPADANDSLTETDLMTTYSDLRSL